MLATLRGSWLDYDFLNQSKLAHLMSLGLQRHFIVNSVRRIGGDPAPA